MGYSIDICRMNKDVHCNNYGQLLLNLCKTNNLLIVNGRFDNNSRGDLSFRNISAIDYFLCDPDIFKHMDDFIVKVRNPILSDGHSALQLKLNCISSVPGTHDKITNPNYMQPAVMVTRWDTSKVVAVSACRRFVCRRSDLSPF